MRLTGVIKGTVNAAIAAAEKREIGIKVLHILPDSVTVEFPTEQQWDSVYKWFQYVCLGDMKNHIVKNHQGM